MKELRIVFLYALLVFLGFVIGQMKSELIDDSKISKKLDEIEYCMKENGLWIFREGK